MAIVGHQTILRNHFVIDVKVAPDLISTFDLKETKVVCADKGYDSEPLS